MKVEQGFQQTSFIESNPYTSDPVLPALLRRIIPKSDFDQVNSELTCFGEAVERDIKPLANVVGQPTLTQYDQWGRRVDRLQTSEGWRALKAFSQIEGFPAIFYERKYGQHSRPYGFAKALLMVGDSHEVFCPLSMTDGAARVLELLGTPGMKKHVLPRLISRDPSTAFVSGQWMTERPGGSDISQTETTATPKLVSHSDMGKPYSINGFKWFSSATDSHISIALARTGPSSSGSRGLSLFLVPLRWPLFPSPQEKPGPTSNNIYIHRLKNKIGTHTLPTAELSLEGSTGFLIGSLGEGVKNITAVLNITRVWSAIASVGGLRKCLEIASSYATVRSVYDKQGQPILLKDAPLHVEQLAQISLTYRALSHFVIGVARLLGESEVCPTETTTQLLRIMTPTVKAFCAQLASGAMEEAMTTLGGAGYMEENGFGRIIRDSLVEKIWEGTTTVMSLDLVRAITRNPSSIKVFIQWVDSILAACPSEMREQSCLTLKIALEAMGDVFVRPMSAMLPRPALMLVGYICSSAFLLEHAIWAFNESEVTADVDENVFVRWVTEGGFRETLRQVQEWQEGNRSVMNSRIVFGHVKTKL